MLLPACFRAPAESVSGQRAAFAASVPPTIPTHFHRYTGRFCSLRTQANQAPGCNSSLVPSRGLPHRLISSPAAPFLRPTTPGTCLPTDDCGCWHELSRASLLQTVTRRSSSTSPSSSSRRFEFSRPEGCYDLRGVARLRLCADCRKFPTAEPFRRSWLRPSPKCGLVTLSGLGHASSPWSAVVSLYATS